MSYLVYINGQQILISESRPIAYTKQVNDLARFDNRQSNFAHKFIAPYNAVNKRIMEKVYFIGNQSNIPYQKNRVDIIDADSGKHLIYNGWANITTSNPNGYEIYTYDGIIDFYRAIENKTLTDVGISELNHLKNLETIVESWNDELNYKYIIADYGGKVYTDDGKLNSDYLVPSARKSFLFERIHEFAGFTFSGSVFDTEKYKNLWLTFPKPVPTEEPVVIPITSQEWQLATNASILPYMINPFPAEFTSIYANNTGAQIGTVNITQTGSYSLKAFGNLIQAGAGLITSLGYASLNALGETIQEGLFNPTIDLSVIVNCEAGGKLQIIHYSYFFGFAGNITGNLTTSLALIEGYTASFDEALLDFSAKDLVNEIMQHFGLTAFKDKFSKHIDYLTLDEILQNEEVIDWSEKFRGKGSEKYILGNYAKKNNYSYRYNGENEKHNDGFITIDNENLKDETTILLSKIYSPEKNKRMVLTHLSNIYKIWDKELKDDSTLEYKELTGRYYFLRSETKTFLVPQPIRSDVLNTDDTFLSAPFESYFRLNLQQVIYDNYSAIESILYKAKTPEALFDLKPIDVAEFDFKRMIVVKQMGSYYLVNKILNFVKGQLTRCELVKVDYFRELVVPEPTELEISLVSAVLDECEVTFTLTTNIAQPSEVQIIPYCLTPDGIGGFYYAPYPLSTPITATMNSNQVVYSFSELPEMGFGGWKFLIRYTSSVFEMVDTQLTDVINLPGTCYVPTAPPTPSLSFLIITEVETLVVTGNVRKVKVTYLSDLTDATMVLTLSAIGGLAGFVEPIQNLFAPASGTMIINLNHSFGGTVFQYNLTLSALGVTSNTAITAT